MYFTLSQACHTQNHSHCSVMGACGKGPDCGTRLKGREHWLRLILRSLLIGSLAASVPPFYTQSLIQHYQQPTASLKATASSQLRTQLRELLILLSPIIFHPNGLKPSPTCNYRPTGYTARSHKSWVTNVRPCRPVNCNKCATPAGNADGQEGNRSPGQAWINL